MSQKFQLYLNADPLVQQECIKVLNTTFDTDVIPWYEDAEGNFKNFYKLKTNKDGNKWLIAKEIKDTHIGVIEVDPVIFLTGQTGAYESDEDYAAPGHENWNHDITRFPEAIVKSISDGKLIKDQVTSIRIAHLDTGVTSHPELPTFAETGYNFVEENTNVIDLMDDGLLKNPGHGTGTASVIVGQQQTVANDFNNGVFQYANLVPYRIAKSVVHFINSNIDEAVIHAVKKGVDVITMSMGGAPPRRSWKEAAQFAYENGVIFCSAAGNNVKFVIWPAAYEEVLAIAAINVNKEPWEGSCRGGAVDISAPGENVYVARAKKADATMVYDQGYGSGTSYATPHIAAAAALWLNHFSDEIKVILEKPNAKKSDKVDLFRTALLLSAQAHNDPDYNNDYGAGILDAYNLLQFSPSLIIEKHDNELRKIRSIAVSGRGFGADNVNELIQKEMLDLMINNEHEDYSSMLAFIESNGTQDAKLAFDNLTTMSPASADKEGKTRGMLAEELDDVRQLFVKQIIDKNF